LEGNNKDVSRETLTIASVNNGPYERTGSYQSYAAFSKDNSCAVVVLCNYMIDIKDMFVDPIGQDIFQLLMKEFEAQVMNIQACLRYGQRSSERSLHDEDRINTTNYIEWTGTYT